MKRVVLALALIIAGLPAISTQAQNSGNSVIPSQLSGEVIDLGDSGTVVYAPEFETYRETQQYREEYFGFTSWWSSFVIGFIEGPITFEMLRATTTEMLQSDYESFQILAENQSDSYEWFMATVVFEGIELAVYYEHQVDAFGDLDFVFMQYSEPFTMVSDFSLIQQEVTIAGQPILGGTDPQRLEDALKGDAEQQSSTSGPGVVISNTDVRVDVDAESLSEVMNRGQDSQGSESEADDWEEYGLISDSEWASPMYGTRISWDSDIWRFPFEYPYAYISVENPPYDGISIVTLDGAGWLDFSVHNTGSYLTPQDYLNYWWTPEYAAEFPAGLTIVASSVMDSTVSIVAETTGTDGKPMLLVMTATFLADGHVVQSQLYAHPDQVIVMYGLFYDSISANGSPLQLTWTVQELQETLGG